MNTDERRHLEMMAATIAAGMGSWDHCPREEVATIAVRRARAIQEEVQELQAAKESNGA
jgi:hypothetical protein